ncbi:MAG: tRNA pseudouridine(38-40) synthase TruA [Cyclobacteriaceae bacterium]|nr:tRNA pseudouridine(38-40) synthase TruA [Cyclobacteriaceae bacterium]
MRYFFEITYNGTHYHGWQNQANAVGVQQVVEDGMTKVFRQPVEIVGSGRTDTGVHCVQQFFHADIEKDFDQSQYIQKLNSILPRDIAIRAIHPVKDTAHARYDAYERAYEYKITRTKNPLLIGQAYYFFKPIDIKTMNTAAALLVGSHDFECFSKVKTDVNHFICDIKKAHWNEKDDLLVFSIVANRFLRGMVRAIVGTLLEVGSGKISVDDFKQILKSKDRKKAGMNVPPEGLYLVSVKYPKKIFK